MSEVFLNIVNMSISASWLVLAVLLLRLVLKKAPKWVNVLLWGLVAIRLILPFSIESALSLIPSTEAIPERVITDLVVAVPTETPRFDVPNQDQTDAPVRDEIDDQDTVDVASPEKPGIPAVTVLTTVWAAGVGAMLIYTAFSYLLLRRRVATAVRLRGNIYQSESVDSPFVLGVVQPRIYLPFRMDSRDLAHVIAHEEAHIRRKDHWWKPFGFVLLAIHWFNPIIWAGFILLCRDIELACDEKVIREMDNETKADYTEALVACSVNRRRIAACPLAFGEVGVKERVKTVMNYKKPAFWIVIAAVALCIVVAVCFLTDPKEAKPDVSILEFPGLKWGMTPEEVKTALEISEDMIIKAEHIDYEPYKDEFRLTISGAQYFGLDADNLIFRFWEYNNKTVLYAVQVTYPSETNMTVVRDNLIEIYGPGTDYGFTNYELSRSPGETEYTVQSYIDWNNSNSIEFGKSIEENAKNPQPTDEINHRWASTAKGSEIISKEDLEIIIKAFGDDVGTYADRDTVLEYLDKKVLVTIRCRDGYTIEDVEFRPAVVFAAPYITHIKGAYQSATGDETAASDPKVDDPALLEFPGLKWGMTVDEVKAALKIKEDQILKDEQIVSSPGNKVYDEWELYIKDLTVFDRKVTLGIFTFIARTEDQIPEGREYMDHTSGKFVLQGVRVFLDEETDMEKLEQTMTAVYGQGVGGVYQYTDALSTGNPNKTAINANPYVRAMNKRGSVYQEALNDPNYQEQMWVCTDPMSTSEKIRDYFVDMLSSKGHSEEDIQEWLNQSPWITLRLVNNTYEAIRIEAGDFKSAYTEYITRNSLEYRTNEDVCIAQSAALKGSTE